MELIKVDRHSNCRQWYQVLLGGCLFDEVKSRSQALRIASKIARQRGEKFVVFQGFTIDINELK